MQLSRDLEIGHPAAHFMAQGSVKCGRWARTNPSRGKQRQMSRFLGATQEVCLSVYVGNWPDRDEGPRQDGRARG